MSADGKSADGRPASRVDRRFFIRAAGGSTMLAMVGAPTAEAAVRTGRTKWDRETDLLVVGSGLAALSAAAVATMRGTKVTVIEANAVAGGASARSAGGMWIPNNRHMRAAGLTDPRDDAIRYMARYSFTDQYDPTADNYGLSEPAIKLIEAMYDHAAPAVELLEEIGAMQTATDIVELDSEQFSYDYWDHAPENKAPQGRQIFAKTPRAPGAAPSFNGGAVLIERLVEWLKAKNVPILFEHRATKLVTNKDGAVIGAIVSAEGGSTIAIRARRGVHFGSGGFTLNDELRRNFQRGPVYGSCGPMTNQGDFVHMATEIGAKLGNMQNGWRFQLVLDQVVQTPGLATDVWFLIGDSMMVVNKYGKRVVNEKRPYNDRSEVHFAYDADKNEWQNLVLFKIFDQRVLDINGGLYPIPPTGSTAPYVLSSPTLEGLAKAIEERLSDYSANIGGFQLDKTFSPNLRATVDRFNRSAAAGVDEEFHRGDYRYDQQIHERFGGKFPLKGHEPNKNKNRTMYPLNPSGPYYAILLVAGNADTNGGPVINENSQIMSVRNTPIPGLYGAGNCISSPAGRAYWGGGATLGLAVTFGYIAGTHAAAAAVNQDS